MVKLDQLVRQNVLKMTPYSCARDEFEGTDGIFMDANENPYGNLNRYPDPYQKLLKLAISKDKVIEENKIFLGNGSDEIIDLCFRVFCEPGNDKALTFTPSYGMYEVSAAVNDVEMLKISLNEDFQIDLKKTEQLFSDKKLKLIFICSPNNPTGNSMNKSDMECIVSRFNGIVIIDEAYIDFSEKSSMLSLIKEYPNLIVTQTFSKAFGLASIRVGMAFANPEIISYLNKLKPPYNISTLNQNAALKRLVKRDKFNKQVNKIKKEREKLSTELDKIPLVNKVYSTDANFFLVKVNDATLLYNKLVEMKIIVRNRNSVINNCLRITVGKPSENRKLIKALKSISL